MRKGRADKASGGTPSKSIEERVTKRPVGMLARLPSVAEVDRELVLDLAEILFPGIEHLDQLSPEQRARWIVLQTSLVQNPSVLKESFLEGFQSIFEKEVEAQVSEALERGDQQELALPGLGERRLEALRERAKQRVAYAAARRQIPPPPSAPTYDRLFGNQIRWALHVIRYALQERRLKSAASEIK